ncbi:MAG: hypothetical protein QM726_12690 [Chitinophagaceae bacterium]
MNKAIGQADTVVQTPSTKVDTIVRPVKFFVLQAGGGISAYTGKIDIGATGLPGSIYRNKAMFTARFMWYPSYRLRMGFESGYLQFYSYNVKNGNSNGSVNLTAIPLLFVFSMQVVDRINISAGLGAYWLTTRLQYNGKVNSSALELGSNIALSYTYPLSNKLGLAVEAEWLNAYVSKDAALALKMQLVWKFVQWK